MAWTFFRGNDREVLRQRIAMDADTWARGRGWALWKAAMTYEEAVRTDPSTAHAAGLRFGWRRAALDVLRDVIDDHRRKS